MENGSGWSKPYRHTKLGVLEATARLPQSFPAFITLCTYFTNIFLCVQFPFFNGTAA